MLSEKATQHHAGSLFALHRRRNIRFTATGRIIEMQPQSMGLPCQTLLLACAKRNDAHGEHLQHSG